MQVGMLAGRMQVGRQAGRDAGWEGTSTNVPKSKRDRGKRIITLNENRASKQEILEICRQSHSHCSITIEFVLFCRAVNTIHRVFFLNGSDTTSEVPHVLSR
jgi:hypothetical protein